MTKRSLLLLAIVVCALGAAPRARAESSQGGAFQLPFYGARGWGMAGAFVARVDDESAIDWNAAGLGHAPRTALTDADGGLCRFGETQRRSRCARDRHSWHLSPAHRYAPLRGEPLLAGALSRQHPRALSLERRGGARSP